MVLKEIHVCTEQIIFPSFLKHIENKATLFAVLDIV